MYIYISFCNIITMINFELDNTVNKQINKKINKKKIKKKIKKK